MAMLCWHVGVTKTGRDVSTFTHANELGLFSFPVPFSLPHSRYNHIKTLSKSCLSCLFFTLLSLFPPFSPSFLLSVCLFVCLRGGNNFRFATHICVLCRLKVGNTFFQPATCCYLDQALSSSLLSFFLPISLSLSSSESHSCAIFYASSLVWVSIIYSMSNKKKQNRKEAYEISSCQSGLRNRQILWQRSETFSIKLAYTPWSQLKFRPLEVAAINQLLSNFPFEENFQQLGTYSATCLQGISTSQEKQQQQLQCEYLLSSSLCNKLSLVHWFLYSASWLVILFKSRFFMSILFQQLLRFYFPPLSLSVAHLWFDLHVSHWFTCSFCSGDKRQQLKATPNGSVTISRV